MFYCFYGYRDEIQMFYLVSLLNRSAFQLFYFSSVQKCVYKSSDSLIYQKCSVLWHLEGFLWFRVAAPRLAPSELLTARGRIQCWMGQVHVWSGHACLPQQWKCWEEDVAGHQSDHFLSLSQDSNEIFHKYLGQQLAVSLLPAFNL